MVSKESPHFGPEGFDPDDPEDRAKFINDALGRWVDHLVQKGTRSATAPFAHTNDPTPTDWDGSELHNLPINGPTQAPAPDPLADTQPNPLVIGGRGREIRSHRDPNQMPLGRLAAIAVGVGSAAATAAYVAWRILDGS